jgi:polypyrimidine tract-binding protein 2
MLTLSQHHALGLKMAEPSKVLHIRNVGPEITEHDLLQLAQAFGVPQKIVML